MILLVVVAIGCSNTTPEVEVQKASEVSIQVFIVTKSRENMKLGLVNVNAIPYGKKGTSLIYAWFAPRISVMSPFSYLNASAASGGGMPFLSQPRLR